jgi:hypothetical protein
MLDRLPAQEEYFFFDDFEDGFHNDAMPSNWVEGTWSGASLYVEDGDLHIEACQLDPPRECSIAPQDRSGSFPQHGDVSLRLRTRILDGDVVIAVWGRYSTGPVYYGFIRSDNVMGVGDTLVTIPGNRTELPFPGDVTTEDVVMKVDFIGDETSLAVWPADATPSEIPIASFRDGSLRSGSIGITNFPRAMATEPTSIVIRWIEVAEILPGDVDTNSVIDMEDIDHLADALLEEQGNNRYDVDRDGTVNSQDHEMLIHQVLRTWYGDADLNGEFNSGDLVKVFAAGEYEDASAHNSGWAEGDWNGDRDFTSTDLVVAFQDGGYERGPRPEMHAVPEPTSFALLIAALIGAASASKSRGKPHERS